MQENKSDINIYFCNEKGAAYFKNLGVPEELVTIVPNILVGNDEFFKCGFDDWLEFLKKKCRFYVRKDMTMNSDTLINS